jgi:hypothetical protein
MMADNKNYSGGCHCGQVRFDVTADLSSVTQCNCSICQKRGALWTFVPSEHFALRAGAEDLRYYQFGKRTIHHLFCPQCGVGSFSRGQAPGGAEMVAVNVRCLDDVDIATLNITLFDGRSL